MKNKADRETAIAAVKREASAGDVIDKTHEVKERGSV
jgi:hypothetical protein